DSTLAYQGGARGVAVGWPAGFPRPDRTYLLDLPPGVGLARQRAARRPADRLEAEAAAFHEAVAAAYRRLAAAEPARFVRLDATCPPEDVHRAVMADLGRLLR
ncbi:MAG TPA: dTMP kinase, partial [Candidatus Dormibacteraeota bacterium]|nr:dTMP kinase [Candidatus Dormibacteraeota bacterium]